MAGGAGSTSSGAGSTFMLIGGQQSDLQRYVNSRVEVRGTLESPRVRPRPARMARAAGPLDRRRAGLDDGICGRRLDGGFDRIPGFIHRLNRFDGRHYGFDGRRELDPAPVRCRGWAARRLCA